MARVAKRRWETNFTSGLPRRDRQGCDYEAYIPDPLANRIFALEGSVAADLADAESAITRMNARAHTLIDTEALARLLLRAESVASSKIEGLEVGPRRLMRAEIARSLDGASSDVTTGEVLNNINAMSWAVETLAAEPLITPRGLLEINRRLMEGTQLAEQAGEIRSQQNWIGGSSYNPCSAVFVPPPPELVGALLQDLCDFCNGDSLPPVAQAAIAHAQFETIHPFIDGNGRTGRALIHVILRRRGLADRALPPISLVLATRAEEYIAGLSATRYLGRADSMQARAGYNTWISTFAAAAQRSVEDANAFEDRILGIQDQWRASIGRLRAGSAVDLLIRALPGAPILTVASAAQLIGRSFQQTNAAIARLAANGVVTQVSVGNRNRAFEATKVIDAFVDLERRLASPEGDTRSSPPARRVPRRS